MGIKTRSQANAAKKNPTRKSRPKRILNAITTDDLFRGEQVFDRRSAVEDYRSLAVRHGLVNLDASGSQASCDGLLV